jgi:peptidoglycan/LPS O-acetylase OafA/YrhL
LSASKQVLQLTSLRFFAGLWIVLFHAAPAYVMGAPFWFRNMVLGGYAGTTLFFVLSGFVLAYRYVPDADTLEPKRFWIGRFARLYPAYAVGLLVSLPMLLQELAATDASGRGPLYAALFLAPTMMQSWFPAVATRWNTPAWSLSTIGLFYILFPFVISWVPTRERRSLMKWALGLLLFALAWPVAYMLVRPDGITDYNVTSSSLQMNVLKFNPLARLPEFIIGMLFGRMFLERRSNSRKLGPALTLISVALLLVLLAPDAQFPYPLLHNGLLIPVVGLLIYGTALGGWPARLLSVSPLVRLGQGSFSLFVLHYPLWHWINAADRALALNWSSSWLFLVGYVALAFAVALASYHWVEVPMRRLLSGRLGIAKAAPSRKKTEQTPASEPTLAYGD